MLAAVRKPYADFSPLQGLRHVALAVSGGSDSMGLLRLVCDWARENADAPALSVLTVDHGLRPEAAGEALQVAGWARGLGVAHHILRWEGEKPSSGIQAAARQARYDLMANWSRGQGAEMTLTAHSADDQAETVLMRLRRTSSPASLAGIPERGHWRGLPLLRPLLSARRHDIRAYLSGLGQDWIEDPSNADPRFERVRIRAEMDGLAARGVTPERLAALAQACAKTAGLLESCAQRWLALHLDERDTGFCRAPLAALTGLPPALQQHIMGLIVSHYGGGRHRPEPKEVLRLVEKLPGSFSRATLAGAIIGRRKDSFWVTREAARIGKEALVIGTSGSAVWDGRYRIEAPEGTMVTAAMENAPEADGQAPIHARRAYPKLNVPAGIEQREKITFLRLVVPS